MRPFVAALLVFAVLGAAPAFASGGGAKKKPAEAEAAEQGPRAPSFSMPILVTPVIIQGELQRYVYLGVTLELVNESDKAMMLEKIPYIQDAFLREVHNGTSIALNGDPALLDLETLSKRLGQVGDAVVGPNIVKKIELRDAANDLR